MPAVAVVGPWAKEKLDTLGRYLDYYTKVLKNQTWCRTIYVDAFAGGGRAVIRAKRKLPEGQVLLLQEEDADEGQAEFIAGSPRVALEVANPFARYVFIEPDPARHAELIDLQREYEERRTITLLQTDAASGINWVVAQKISKKSHRGVAFLDPFGASLEWRSIEHLARTGLFEVVINFALSMAIQRMLPNDGNVPEAWRKTLDGYFGTGDWYSEVYGEPPRGLFEPEGVEKRHDYHDRLLNLYSSRLKAAFGLVSTPRLIRNQKGAPLYYLIWAGPNPKGLKGADYILQMGEQMKDRPQKSKT